MKMDKRLELNQKILFDKDQLEIINLLSNKNYKISLANIDNDDTENTEEKNNLILEYLLKKNSDLKQNRINEILLE